MEQSIFDQRTETRDAPPETGRAVEVGLHKLLVAAWALILCMMAAVLAWAFKDSGLSGIYNAAGPAVFIFMTICAVTLCSSIGWLNSIKVTFGDRGITTRMNYRMLFVNLYTHERFAPWDSIVKVFELDKMYHFYYQLEDGKKGRVGLNFATTNNRAALMKAAENLPASLLDDESIEIFEKMGIRFLEPEAKSSDTPTVLCFDCGTGSPVGTTICPHCRHLLPKPVNDPPKTKVEQTPEPVSDKWMWALVSVPIIGMALQELIYAFIGPFQMDYMFYGTVNGALIMFDRMELKMKGHRLKGFWYWIGVAIAPLYMTVRAAKVNRPYIYILLWGVSLAAGLYIASHFEGGGKVESGIRREFNNIENMEMIYVEGGTFMMGCTPEQAEECLNHEKPAHSVTVSDFSIGKYEVTQKIWEEVMGGENPSYFTGEDLPVENVSWDDIQIFIIKLNAMTGMNYRLPTEAEWEYAARGGSKSKGYKYSGSDNIDEVAWYAGRATRPVGTKKPNELGIHDMSGNVAEWVSDWYAYYTLWHIRNPSDDPAGPPRGRFRVNRNVGFAGGDEHGRVSSRGGITPNARLVDCGFRLVLPGSGDRGQGTGKKIKSIRSGNNYTRQKIKILFLSCPYIILHS